jgi:hypothetical protein
MKKNYKKTNLTIMKNFVYKIKFLLVKIIMDLMIDVV